jgi:hypothetical protein
MADTALESEIQNNQSQDQIQKNQNQDQDNQNSSGNSGSGSSNYESDDQLLLRFNTSLDVAITDPVIQPKLAEYGYTVEKLTNMKDWVVKVSGLFATKNMVHGVQLQASKDVELKYMSANKDYKIALEIARQVFKNDPKAKTSLLLRGRRKRTMAGWKMQTETFYSNLLASPDLMTAMGEFGYTESKISAELKKVQDVITADITHKKNFGNSVEATATRDAELDALEETMSTFYNIAGAVFADNPQAIEKLAIR